MFKNYLFNCNKLNENKIIVNLVYGTYHKELDFYNQKLIL
jgi:uncharacterized protein YkvS